MHHLFFYLRPFALILREGEGEGGSGGGNGGGEGFFKPGGGSGGEGGEGEGGSKEGGEGGNGGGEGGDPPKQPEWLMDKYLVKDDEGNVDLSASAQKQAEGYRDLYGRFSKKTDDLRAEVRDEAAQKYGETIGVPDDPAKYEYPDGVNAPGEELDKGLREWAQANNVSPDGFKSLINDVWMKSQVDHKAEAAKLGKTEEEVEKRVDEVNNWIGKNIAEKHHGVVADVMKTAAGVEFFEALAEQGREGGFAPDDGGGQGVRLTRENIRNMQADERFGRDEDYTKYVRGLWNKFAAGKQYG